METRLGQAALLVVATEAISSRLPPCRGSGGGCWGTLWGPLTPRHAMKDHLPWPPELPAPPWPPELPASPWPPLSVSLWRSPSCGPVHVCPEGPPERPPLPGGGSYVRVLLCVSCVPASCVHIWFVPCPRLMWLLVNSCPAVFVSLSMIIPVYL